MPDYNYVDGWLFAAAGINSDADYSTTSAVVAADLDYIGVKEAGSGWKIEPSNSKRDNVGGMLTLMRELKIEAKVLTIIPSATKTAIDGVTCSLVYIPADGVTVDREAETFTLETGADGILLCPCEINIVEDYKLGQEDPEPIMVTGSIKKATKALLQKTISYSQSA